MNKFMEKLWLLLKRLALICSYFIYSITALIPVLIFNIDIKHLTSKQEIILTIFSMIIYLLFLILIYHKILTKEAKNNSIDNLVIGSKYWAIGLVIMSISNIIIARFIPNGATNEQIVQSEIASFPLYMLFSTVVFAPIVEELLFRKTIRDMIPKNNILYIIISGLAFGFIHTLAGGSLKELIYIIPYGTLGAMFALSYVKTKSIYVPMFYHALHNFIIVSISIIGNIL